MIKKCLCLLVSVLMGCMALCGCSEGDSSKYPKYKYSDKVEYVQENSLVTGRNATTDTTQWQVGSTDMGFACYDSTRDRMLYFFGDTFASDSNVGESVRDWRSNVVGFSTDFDLSNGLSFDSFYSDRRGRAESITQGANVDYFESTRIPTGAIEIGGNIYMFFMSVCHWGPNHYWDVNFNSVMKSSDGGESWNWLYEITWINDTYIANCRTLFNNLLNEDQLMARNAPCFGQIYPMADKDGEYIYLYGIPGGRQSGVKLARVKNNVSDFEDFSSYEYYLGTDKDGNAVWGNQSQIEDFVYNSENYVIPAEAGEMCVNYNPYLKKYIATYQMFETIGFRTADTPWGEWSDFEKLLSYDDVNLMYSCLTHPKMWADGGKTMYFLMGHWEIYNVRLMKLVLK